MFIYIYIYSSIVLPKPGTTSIMSMVSSFSILTITILGYQTKPEGTNKKISSLNKIYCETILILQTNICINKFANVLIFVEKKEKNPSFPWSEPSTLKNLNLLNLLTQLPKSKPYNPPLHLYSFRHVQLPLRKIF